MGVFWQCKRHDRIELALVVPLLLPHFMDEVVAVEAHASINAVAGGEDVASARHTMLEGVTRGRDALSLGAGIEQAAVDALMDSGGYDPELGARPMRRTGGTSRISQKPRA